MRVLNSQHDPVADKRFSDALTEVACLREGAQRSHVCIKGFVGRLIPTVEHITLVCFICFTDGELVEFLYDVFQLLPFLGVVKGHSIKNFQSFRPDTVKKKSDLIGLRLLVDIHYNCVITPCLLEGFPVFCDILFNVEMTRRVNSLNRECYLCGARHTRSNTGSCRHRRL